MNEILERKLKLLNMINQAFDQYVAGAYETACRKGCAVCCTHDVTRHLPRGVPCVAWHSPGRARGPAGAPGRMEKQKSFSTQADDQYPGLCHHDRPGASDGGTGGGFRTLCPAGGRGVSDLPRPPLFLPWHAFPQNVRAGGRSGTPTGSGPCGLHLLAELSSTWMPTVCMEI